MKSVSFETLVKNPKKYLSLLQDGEILCLTNRNQKFFIIQAEEYEELNKAKRNAEYDEKLRKAIEHFEKAFPDFKPLGFDE